MTRVSRWSTLAGITAGLLGLTVPASVATRYDKREFMYQGTVDVASIRIWLRDPVT